MAFKYKLKEVELGDIKVEKGVKSTVTDIDPQTGAITWSVNYVPAFDSTFKEFDELRKYITKLSRDTKDEVIDNIANDIKISFNQYRTHLRKNYSDEYKKIIREEDIDEMSTSGGSGAYLTKYAFKLPKKQEKIVPEGVGATLGPGPKASEDGVKDNAYIKQFKYKLVPKDKNGNYVQKGSGLEVKNL